MYNFCFIFGDCGKNENVEQEIYEAIKEEYDRCGIYEFIVEYWNPFGLQAMRAVMRLREEHEEVWLRILLPCEDAKEPAEIRRMIDGYFVPEWNVKMSFEAGRYRTRRYMVLRAVSLVCRPGKSRSVRQMIDFAQIDAERGTVRMRVI